MPTTMRNSECLSDGFLSSVVRLLTPDFNETNPNRQTFLLFSHQKKHGLSCSLFFDRLIKAFQKDRGGGRAKKEGAPLSEAEKRRKVLEDISGQFCDWFSGREEKAAARTKGSTREEGAGRARESTTGQIFSMCLSHNIDQEEKTRLEAEKAEKARLLKEKKEKERIEKEKEEQEERERREREEKQRRLLEYEDREAKRRLRALNLSCVRPSKP